MAEKRAAAAVRDQDFVPAGRRDLELDHTYGSQSFWRDALSRFGKNKGAVFGLVMIVVIVFMAFAGPALSGYDYRTQDMAQRNLPPHVAGLEVLPFFSGIQTQTVGGRSVKTDVYAEKGIKGVTHVFGTDTLGRDQFARTWTGTRVSLYVALLAILIDTFVGMSYGLVSGYFGGRVDFFLQRIVEILSTIPTTVIVTLLIVVMKPGLTSITIALMITEWIGMSRVARAQTLRLKEQEFVLASQRHLYRGVPGFHRPGHPGPSGQPGLPHQRRVQIHDNVPLHGGLPGGGAGPADAQLQPAGRRSEGRL